MKIRGNTVGTPMKRPDFNQKNPKKSDYIKNNPLPELTEADEGKVLCVSGDKFVLTNLEKIVSDALGVIENGTY